MTLWLRVRAPFAAFRWMQAGVYRATSPIIPPSAAWGLVLNLAHVETRASGEHQTTPIRANAPALRLVVGAVSGSGVGTLYQQLHSYPVGSSGKNLKERGHGAKYWIAPRGARFLIGFDAMIGVESSESGVLERVVAGLRGELGESRYGLPFAGDNNFLLDRIDVLETPPKTRWYERVDTSSMPRSGSCRLTIAIDRRDAARSSTGLFAPTEPPGPTRPRVLGSGSREIHDRRAAIHPGDGASCHHLLRTAVLPRGGRGDRVADARVHAGRALHEQLDEPQTVTRLNLESSELGIRGRVDAVRTRAGEFYPIEHKRGRARKLEDGCFAPWPSDRLQAIAYAVLLEEHTGREVEHARVRYHASSRTVRIPIDDAARSGAASGDPSGTRVAVCHDAASVTGDERKCPRCSLVPVCLPEEARCLYRAS